MAHAAARGCPNGPSVSVVVQPQAPHVISCCSPGSGHQNSMAALHPEHETSADLGAPQRSVRQATYPAIGPSPIAARRSSTVPGSRSLRGCQRPSRPNSCVPNSCGWPSASRTRSVSKGTSPRDASRRSAASSSKVRHLRCKAGSRSACCARSQAARAPSSPTTDRPGQPTSATTCLRQARFSADRDHSLPACLGLPARSLISLGPAQQLRTQIRPHVIRVRPAVPYGKARRTVPEVVGD
jgi:hypothetical protein